MLWGGSVFGFFVGCGKEQSRVDEKSGVLIYTGVSLSGADGNRGRNGLCRRIEFTLEDVAIVESVEIEQLF